MRKPNSARDGTVGPHARWKRRKRALLAFDKLPIRFISSGTNDTNNAAADLGWQRLLNLSSSSTSTTLLSGRHHFPVAERTFHSRHPYRTSRTHVYIYESTFYTIYRYITRDYTPLATLTSKPIPALPYCYLPGRFSRYTTLRTAHTLPHSVHTLVLICSRLQTTYTTELLYYWRTRLRVFPCTYHHTSPIHSYNNSVCSGQ